MRKLCVYRKNLANKDFVSVILRKKRYARYSKHICRVFLKPSLTSVNCIAK